MKSNQSQALARTWTSLLASQAGAYGRAVPVIIGTARVESLTDLLIWQAELRKENSGKKAKKKGQTTYAENADFLIGHNPIAGPLQVWHDTDTKLPLAFAKQTFSSVSGGFITITDPDFYFVLAVTLTLSYSVTFNDYGSQGANPQSGTYELPLWNVNYAGPDATNESGYRFAPFVYQWDPQPLSGNVIAIPFNGPDGPWGAIWLAGTTVNVYYAKLDPTGFASQGKFKGVGTIVPIAALFLEFEPQLAEGTEYTTPGNFSSQRQQKTWCAGLGSPQLDLGSSGSIPIIRPEIAGAFVINPPRGDADFMDMVEWIFKSGPSQAGDGASTAFGEIHWGLGCLDYPGVIQKNWDDRLEAFNLGAVGYHLRNTPNNWLVAVYDDVGGTGTGGASDTLGDSFTQVGGDPVYYTQTVGGYPNAISIAGRGGPLSGGDNCQLSIFEVGGLDTLASAAKYTGTGTIKLNITTSQPGGEPAYILVCVRLSPFTGGQPADPVLPQWSKCLRGPANSFADQRTVRCPGTYQYVSPIAGGQPWSAYVFIFQNSQPVPFPNPLGNILDDGPTGTMQTVRDQDRANGLIGSIVMDSQQDARQWLEDIFFAANAAPVWSGFKLKALPWSEVSAAGNGAIYNAPTASGPIANLKISDFVAEPGTPPVTIERTARIDPPNLQSIQHANRSSDYNPVVTSQPDNGAISFYGTRKDSPRVLRCIQDVSVALMLLGISVRRANSQAMLNNYKFKLNPKWKLLEPMDLITIPLAATLPVLDPSQPPSGTVPLRLTSVVEDDKFQLDCEAEPFIYGLNAPVPPAVASSPTPNLPQTGADPGPVNTPIIFEPVTALYNQQNQQKLRLIVSCPSTIYGGSAVYLSTDGGTTYTLVGQIQGNAATGVVAGSTWPSAADPDTTNDLAVDLTESLGVLNSFSAAQRDQFVAPFYVSGGLTNIPYELGSYNSAVMTAANKYTLKATGAGNELRRAVFGAPQVGTGVAHTAGSRFSLIDPAGTGMLDLTMDPKWIGVTLKFKFLAFNTFGASSQTLSGATAYSYTPTGLVGTVNPNGFPPGIVTVN